MNAPSAKALAEVNDLAGRLVRQFGGGALARSAVVGWGREHAARVLDRLDFLGPRVILEIGTHFAVMSALLAPHCETLITLDVYHHARADEVLEFCEARNVLPIHVEDNKAKTRLVDALCFDLAFIDGDHKAAACRLDFGLVRKCGRVLFHDYTPGSGVAAVADAIDGGFVIPESPFAWWFAEGSNEEVPMPES